MTTDEKIQLITRNLEETLTEDELRALIDSGTPLKHYIGFEISGKVHIGQGLLTMQIIKNFQDAGLETTMLLADWHTWLNKKLDGTLETAQRLARAYFQEALIAATLCAGADHNKIEFILGSELYEKQNTAYWAKVVKVSKATTLNRMLRSTTIMGRKETEVSDAAMLIYPAMQAADIFAMNINIAHAGSDQRNVHIVAREAANELGEPKPVALHHHLLLGIAKPNDQSLALRQQIIEKGSAEALSLLKDEMMGLTEGMKMSKSKPESAVFITDSPEEIRKKVSQAFAPEGEIILNPILDWVKYLVFYNNTTFVIKRDEKWGGDLSYANYADLEKDYAEKKLHPQDLKAAVAEWLIEKLEPARKYFEDPQRKAALEEIEALTVKH